jgi:hypothetical protein
VVARNEAKEKAHQLLYGLQPGEVSPITRMTPEEMEQNERAVERLAALDKAFGTTPEERKERDKINDIAEEARLAHNRMLAKYAGIIH